MELTRYRLEEVKVDRLEPGEPSPIGTTTGDPSEPSPISTAIPVTSKTPVRGFKEPRKVGPSPVSRKYKKTKPLKMRPEKWGDKPLPKLVSKW